ncbi:hypothetical protein PS1_037411 [Malus domestica]
MKQSVQPVRSTLAAMPWPGLISELWGSPIPSLMFDCAKCSARIAVKTGLDRRNLCIVSGATRVFRTRNGTSEARKCKNYSAYS